MDEVSNSLVSTDWLAAHWDDRDVVLLDASQHLPGAKRDARAEFEEGHIPGAHFLDLATLTDESSPVPAALANAQQTAQRLADLGIRPDARIVLYDDSAVRSACRAWFALRAHGLTNVALLDGGFAKWRSEGRELGHGPHCTQPTEMAMLEETQGIVTKADVLSNLESKGFQVLDARARDRVFGSGIDPIHGGQNGRIPGSFNLPFGAVLHENGTFRSPIELKQRFEAAGIDLERPVVTSCGSGLTASVLLFALHLIGKTDTALYDGSWQEWEADPETPKLQGSEESLPA